MLSGALRPCRLANPAVFFMVEFVKRQSISEKLKEKSIEKVVVQVLNIISKRKTNSINYNLCKEKNYLSKDKRFTLELMSTGLLGWSR